MPGAGFALVAAAVWSYARTEVVEAGGGSPYYDSAVKQALTGLRNVGSGGVDVPAGRPPLPAGLDPAEYYWCEQCKTYHKREAGAPAGGQPAAQPAVAVADPFAPPPLLQRLPESPAPGAVQPGAAAALPPLPAGLNPAEYYWCEHCKTYHQREPGAAPGAPPAAQPAPAVDPSAPPALLQRPAGGDPAAPVQHAIPPLPDGLDPANYYWDAASRSYRLRQGTGQ